MDRILDFLRDFLTQLWNFFNAGSFDEAAGSPGYIIAAGVIIIILEIAAMWKIFKKAGKAGWRCLIPILNYFDYYDIIWSVWVGIIRLILPGVAAYLGNMYIADNTFTAGIAAAAISLCIILIIDIVSCFKLAKSFRKGFLFGLGLLLLQPVFILILGFGKSQYRYNVGKH